MPPSLSRSLSSQLSLDPSVDTVFSCLDVDICVDSVWESISIRIPHAGCNSLLGGVASTQPHFVRPAHLTMLSPVERAAGDTDRAWDKAPPSRRNDRAKSQAPLTCQKNNTEVSLRNENDALGFSRSM